LNFLKTWLARVSKSSFECFLNFYVFVFQLYSAFKYLLVLLRFGHLLNDYFGIFLDYYIYIYKKNEAKSLKPNPADIEASSKGPKLVHGFP
jgi:hypothetical protein